ncbi:hypothetical protein [Ensifer sp. Root127]|uniref:hypothetical protein n=1 Tax=Ensifer sp. Root127 TaxID=1736440 RepID=UPI00070B2F3C|nr:hypothetical protein [Ensifer sp. Root127]KQW72338.1 hypothetical protein ASD03_31735 [Ensifer sp. Root127]
MSTKHIRFLFDASFKSTEYVVETSSWDVEAAAGIAHRLTLERGVQPYAFWFESREPGHGPEPKISGTYYLGGKLQTLDELRAENDPSAVIMIHHLEARGIERVVTTNCPCLASFPFRDGDHILEWEPAIEMSIGLR